MALPAQEKVIGTTQNKLSLPAVTLVCRHVFLAQSPASARSHQRSLLAMEETMREEIRELQEQRAAAMMTEIVELQKERDLALGKVKRLEKKVKGIILFISSCVFVILWAPLHYYNLHIISPSIYLWIGHLMLYV